MDVLRILDQQIATRCAAIVEQHPDWPCRRGCDHCCRHLAAEPLVTRAEFERLAPYLPAALPATSRVCPLLDPAQGACTAYDVRPIACRTYGFYVERDRGLYCGMLEERVARGDYANVLWGNQATVESQLNALGERRPLSAWQVNEPRG